MVLVVHKYACMHVFDLAIIYVAKFFVYFTKPECMPAMKHA